LDSNTVEVDEDLFNYVLEYNQQKNKSQPSYISRKLAIFMQKYRELMQLYSYDKARKMFNFFNKITKKYNH